jgi:hypothetical protein
MVLHRIRAGARKWIGPLLGLVFILFLKNRKYFIFCLTRPPDKQISSHRTTTCVPHQTLSLSLKSRHKQTGERRPSLVHKTTATSWKEENSEWIDAREGGEAAARGGDTRKKGIENKTKRRTTRWPLRSSLARIDAKRPSMWWRASTTTTLAHRPDPVTISSRHKRLLAC